MKPAPFALLLSLPAWSQAEPPPPAQPRITLSVREADLRDILRAASAGTDLNLTFEPGMDTVLKGVDLKGATLEEILDQVLPGLGLSYARKGRTLHIQRGDGGLRFYQVDMLALRRTGTKFFQVNASGQVIQSTNGGNSGNGGMGSSPMGQSGGQGGMGSQNSQSGGNSSAYSSTLNSGNGFNPWEEIEQGLNTLIFGTAVTSPATPAASTQGSLQGPTSRSFAKDGRSLVIHPESGLVVVGADPVTHRRVEAYLNEVKRRGSRQVQLEARIVEVTLGNDNQMGVDWQTVLNPGVPSGGVGFGAVGQFITGTTINPNVQEGEGLVRLVAGNARVTATLTALARDGRLAVLSSPRISTLNNQKAILRVVREEAYFLQNSQVTPSGGISGNIATIQITPIIVPVGIVLDILPQVGEDGVITLSVNPSVSEIVTVRSFTVPGASTGGLSQSSGASATLPVVDRRDLDTVVRIRSGETLVLAGIIRTKELDEDRGIPWLRNIPILGALFTKREKSRSHTELAIFITPRLVEDPELIKAEADRIEDRLKKSNVNTNPPPPKKPPITAP